MNRRFEVKGTDSIELSIPISESYEDNGNIYLVGLASVALEKSDNGIVMTEAAIQKMKETCKGLPGFVNHDPDLIFGKIVDVVETSPSEFKPVFEVLPAHDNPDVAAAREKVMYWLDNGIPLGLSVGGSMVDWEISEEYGKDYSVVIYDLALHEVSVTPIPAVNSTRGTLDRVGMSLNQCIAESILIREASWSLYRRGYSHALSLIKSGKYTDASWSKPTLSDFGGDVKEYSLYCLAYDPGGDSDSAGSYGYPYGKNGQVYLNALKAIKSAAAGGRGAEKNQSLYDAADRLLQMVSDKEESAMNDEVKEMFKEIKEDIETISAKLLELEEEPEVVEEEETSEDVLEVVDGKVEEAVSKLLEDEEFLERIAEKVLKRVLTDRKTERPIVKEKPKKVEESKPEAYTSLELIEKFSG